MLTPRAARLKQTCGLQAARGPCDRGSRHLVWTFPTLGGLLLTFFLLSMEDIGGEPYLQKLSSGKLAREATVWDRHAQICSWQRLVSGVKDVHDLQHNGHA